MYPNALNFPNATAAAAFALFPFDKPAFLAKIGYWLERGYGQTIDANGKLTSWTCRYTSRTASAATGVAPTVAPDGSARGNGAQFMEIANELSLQAPGASGTGMHIFARIKTSESAAIKAVAGHWNAAVVPGQVDDWILLANSLGSAAKGSFVVCENTLAAREALTFGDVSTGAWNTLEGKWPGPATGVIGYSDGINGSANNCSVANATALQTTPIRIFRYAGDGAPFTGLMAGDIAALIHFTAPLSTNEQHYVRAYLGGVN